MLKLFWTSITPHLTIAYLDPGTGSMVIQIAIGGIIASLYSIKLYWHRIVAIFKKDSEINSLDKQPSDKDKQ